jgi:hypothetical protein
MAAKVNQHLATYASQEILRPSAGTAGEHGMEVKSSGTFKFASPFSLPAYEYACSLVTQRLIFGLMCEYHPVLKSIQMSGNIDITERLDTQVIQGTDGTPRLLGPVGVSGSLSVLTETDGMVSAMDDWFVAIHGLATQFAPQMVKHMLSTLNTVTEAVGNQFSFSPGKTWISHIVSALSASTSEEPGDDSGKYMTLIMSKVVAAPILYSVPDHIRMRIKWTNAPDGSCVLQFPPSLIRTLAKAPLPDDIDAKKFVEMLEEFLWTRPDQ